MGELKEIIKEEFRNFPSELLERIRQNNEEQVDDMVWRVELLSIQKATSALLEAAVADDKIVSLLQKYWDLRRSEAETMLKQARNRLNKK